MNNTIQTTIGDLATKLKVEYITAASIIKVMEAQGKAKKIGSKPTATGKGKPSSVYELESVLTLQLA